MIPTSPLPALISVVAALVTCRVLIRIHGPPLTAERFAPIEGLRGYLALCVFLSHGCLWYFYLRSGAWVPPPSQLYTHMGESSVVFFFMITAFLFCSKLMDAKYATTADWTRFFLSRLMRLGPLYLVVMIAMFSIVGVLSKGSMREPAALLAKHTAEWLAFTVLGGPDVNRVTGTAVITAGVTWSLPYELAFYCTLPVLALVLRRVPPLRFIVFGLGAGAGFAYLNPSPYKLAGFIGGILASFAVRSAFFREHAAKPLSSLIVIGSVAAAVAIYPTAYELGPLILLSIAFALIASGNDLFGILVHPLSRTLGRMAYGIYLMHGIVLFLTFRFAVGLDAAKSLSPIQHWTLVIGVTPVLLAICHASFRLIEYPGMRSTDGIYRWIRLQLRPRSVLRSPPYPTGTSE
jgi:peptidoglycan/LPS O-acetylase OafA/YrhL